MKQTTIERAKSFDEAKIHEEFEENGYIWLKLSENERVLIMDANSEPIKVEYKEN